MNGTLGAARSSIVRKRKGRSIPTLVLFLVLFVFTAILSPLSFPGRAIAQELALANLVLNNYEGKIRVRFGVEATTTKVIAEALDEGLPLVLRCSAALRKKRRYLWNEELMRAESESSLFKGEDGLYHVTVPEGNAPLSGKDLPGLLRQAWGRIRMDLGDWSRLSRGGAYVIDLEITLLRSDQSSVIDKTASLFVGDIMPPVGYMLDFTY